MNDPRTPEKKSDPWTSYVLMLLATIGIILTFTQSRKTDATPLPSLTPIWHQLAITLPPPTRYVLLDQTDTLTFEAPIVYTHFGCNDSIAENYLASPPPCSKHAGDILEGNITAHSNSHVVIVWNEIITLSHCKVTLNKTSPIKSTYPANPPIEPGTWLPVNIPDRDIKRADRCPAPATSHT